VTDVRRLKESGSGVIENANLGRKRKLKIKTL
jgi:hypothetical protein